MTADRRKIAEDAARAMGWASHEWRDALGTGVWIGWHNARREEVCAPDLDSWAFKGAMIEWLWARGLESLARGAVVDWWYENADCELYAPPEWGERLADAVIRSKP